MIVSQIAAAEIYGRSLHSTGQNTGFRNENTNKQEIRQNPGRQDLTSIKDSFSFSEDAQRLNISSRRTNAPTESENVASKFPDGQENKDSQEVKELQAREREVKTHEQRHRSAGGQYIQGAISYEYKRGPDGNLYVVGGEVNIDTSEVRGNPGATIQKMQTVRRAALAPSNPSPSDRQIAAEALRKETSARSELLKESSITSSLFGPEGLRSGQSSFKNFQIRSYVAGEAVGKTKNNLEIFS